MTEQMANYFIGTAFAAQSERVNFFDIFNPNFMLTPSGGAERTFSTVLGFAMNWVLAIVAIIAFIYLIMSGVNYITAGGDSEKATKARSGILNAIIGIVVVVLAYFILNFATNLAGNLVGQ